MVMSLGRLAGKCEEVFLSGIERDIDAEEMFHYVTNDVFW